ncbi:hypothetical protein BCEP27_60026 [Burkholderia cepacia]
MGRRHGRGQPNRRDARLNGTARGELNEDFVTRRALLVHRVGAWVEGRCGGKAEGRKGGRRRAEGRRQKAEGRRQKAEGRRQKAEGRRQKAEGRRQKA